MLEFSFRRFISQYCVLNVTSLYFQIHKEVEIWGLTEGDVVVVEAEVLAEDVVISEEVTMHSNFPYHALVDFFLFNLFKQTF